MHDVLGIYKQIEMQFDEESSLIPFEEQVVHTLSYGEKTGIQAISHRERTSVWPRSEDEGTSLYQRDYEYKRLGTFSLLTAINLITGDAIPLVSETQEYLNENSGCLEFVFTPKHRFRLNLVEVFFSKMTK